MDMIHESHSIVPPDPKLDKFQRLGLLLLGIGITVMGSSLFKLYEKQSVDLVFWLTLTAIFAGGLIYGIRTHIKKPPGIHHNGIKTNSFTSAGALGWLIGVILTSFYVFYYWWPHQIIGLTQFFDPLSQAIRKKPADQWFVYGALYTVAILIMGTKAIVKYRHSRYQMIRTTSIITSQLFLAFLTPYFHTHSNLLLR